MPLEFRIATLRFNRNLSMRVNSASRKPAPDPSPWPADGTGYISIPMVMHALRGCGQSTVYKWCDDGLLPRPTKIGLSAVGWPVEQARQMVIDLPEKAAALRAQKAAAKDAKLAAQRAAAKDEKLAAQRAAGMRTAGSAE